MKLRSYQTELAESAISGHNTIICAQTGTGKTWVALHITKEHLQKNPEGEKKIIYCKINITSIFDKTRTGRLQNISSTHNSLKSPYFRSGCFSCENKPFSATAVQFIPKVLA